MPGAGVFPGNGYLIFMTEDPRTENRAHSLLPEEIAAGSADPEAQAAAILAESDEREEHPAPADRRTSAQTVTPGEGTR